MTTIKVKKINPNAVLPTKAHNDDACEDLSCSEDCEVKQGELVKVPTGLVFEIPDGYMVEIRPRSGLSSRGVIIPNAPATIDSNYRGEIMVAMYGEFGGAVFKAGDRIAQIRLVRLESTTYCETNEVSETSRGSGGFGSTGK